MRSRRLAGVLIVAIASLAPVPGGETEAIGQDSTPRPAALPLDPKEPFGLALFGTVAELYSTTDKHVRLGWGDAESEACEELEVRGQRPTCFEVSDHRLCRPNSDTWRANFGEAAPVWASPFLLFTPDGRFYGYTLGFAADSFGLIKSILVARLGKPTADRHSTVHNTMNASFNQEELQWTMRHTTAVLVRRTANDLTEGSLEIIYRPLRQRLPKLRAPKAPF